MKITNLEIQIEDYRNHLRDEERSPSTIKQYQRDVISFLSFLDAEELSRERESLTIIMNWNRRITLPASTQSWPP